MAACRDIGYVLDKLAWMRAEGIWPNSAHERGEGINVLTGADAPAPYGGAAFHDNKVWVRKVE